MKKLSETYKELGIAFSFPITIKDDDGNQTYYESSDGFWRRYEYDAEGKETYYESSEGFWRKSEYDTNGNQTYHEDSDGYWCKWEYDANGNETYCEDRDGSKRGNRRTLRVRPIKAW